jgi:Protein of unknown function (DUF2516)
VFNSPISVPLIFIVEYWIGYAFWLGALILMIFALVNSITHSTEEFEVASKLPKFAWVLILLMGVVTQVLFQPGNPLMLFHIIFTVAALVYLTDVKPAIADLRRG